MAVQQYVKPILPKIMPASATTVRANLRRATKRVNDKAAEELRFLFEPWDHKPDVKVKMEESANEIKGTTSTDDPITYYLDGGTEKDWAFVSRDWQSKTTPGSLRSKAGRGRVIFRGRKQMTDHGIPAQRGIDPRKFSKALLDKYAPEFEREINKVMADAIQKGQAVKP